MIKVKVEIKDKYVTFPNGIPIYDSENSVYTNPFRLFLKKLAYNTPEIVVQEYLRVGFGDNGEDVFAWQIVSNSRPMRFESSSYDDKDLIKYGSYYIMKDLINLVKFNEMLEKPTFCTDAFKED